MLKQIVAWGGLCCALPAWAFPIEVTPQFVGAPLQYEAQALARNMAVLHVRNDTSQAQRCSVRLSNGPEGDQWRRVQLAPGEKAAVSASFQREVVRLRIWLNCQPQ
ncbi:hypothetical protein SAMN05216214_111131 [Atopomonas hussainii]|uniref:3-phosphoglycerate kinase n=1 Tax=Atopomonas hussainii TaxID=1429083 RepID=A0A1H7PSV9_9GAMM|nr:hypothetical protein [Atopomonas hussainii]SEL38843.1 hypothetical protein SAMN05216214_111131 [Atopomonas hussainii]